MVCGDRTGSHVCNRVWMLKVMSYQCLNSAHTPAVNLGLSPAEVLAEV